MFFVYALKLQIVMLISVYVACVGVRYLLLYCYYFCITVSAMIVNLSFR